jgi:hypothetical protein
MVGVGRLLSWLNCLGSNNANFLSCQVMGGLAEEDRYSMEINLDDLETSQLKQQDRPFRYVASRQHGDKVNATTVETGVC